MSPLENYQPVNRILLALVAGCVLCWTVGCSSGQIRASKLPAEFQAPAFTNAKTVDLTRFTAATASDEVISPGDVLEVTIAASLSKEDLSTFPVRVNDNGKAKLPLIGEINLNRLQLSEAEALISEACVNSGYYISPQVTVTMKNQKKNRVLVVGGVKNPGTYFVSVNSSDLLSAISLAGGLDEKAGTVVEIRNPESSLDAPERPSIAGNQDKNGHILASNSETKKDPSKPVSQPKATIKVDLASLTANNPSDLLVKDGGVVMVEQRNPKPVHVTGLVKRPNRFEFPIAEDLKLLDAIALAEGTSNPVADKVYVIRNRPNGGKPILIQASIQKAVENPDENIRLAPGDLVSVEKTSSTILLDAVRIINFGVGASVF